MLAGANNNNNDEDDDDDSTVFIEIFLPHISNSSSSINDFFYQPSLSLDHTHLIIVTC